ncbi:hypothetical protein [Propionivibrio sp.]
MRETILLEVVLKADALATPSADEIELLVSILPELLVLMQQHDGDED